MKIQFFLLESEKRVTFTLLYWGCYIKLLLGEAEMKAKFNTGRKFTFDE